MTPLRLLAVLFALGHPAFAVAGPPDERRLDDLISKALKTWSVPGASVVIVQDGKVLYLKGHGLRDTTTGVS